MFPGTKQNVFLAKKIQAEAVRQELLSEKERLNREAAKTKAAQHEQLMRIRNLEEQLEAEKVAKQRKKAHSVGLRNHNAIYLRKIKQLQEIGRLIIEEQQPEPVPSLPSRKAPSSMDDSVSLALRQTLLSQDTTGSNSLLYTASNATQLSATPTGQKTRAVVSERMKEYSRHVKQAYRPERNQQKQLQLELIREKTQLHKPSKHNRVKLSDLI